jgi:Ca2+-binding EF-hand superfamily protein
MHDCLIIYCSPGVLTLPVLLELLTVEHDKEVQASFKMFDKSHNGFITLQDFKDVLREHNDEHNDDEIESMFHKADTDNDKHISYEEFANTYHELR